MPRKSKPPMDFIIEGLSTLERTHSIGAGLSDFDGQPIARPALAPRTARPLPTADEIKLRRKEIAQAKADLQAQRNAKALKQVLVNMIDPPPFKPFKRRF